MINEDNSSYFKFTGRARLDKAIHTLEGLLKGIAIDGVISQKELLIVRGWLAEHEEFADRHPFSEIIPLLTHVLADDRMSDDEHADLAWLCNRINTDSIYYEHATSDMQRLHGLIAGVAFDGKITKDELLGLQNWLEENQHLRTCWPYDELDAIITSTLRDGVLSPEEHQALMEYFSEFASHAGHRSIELPEAGEELLVRGVCAVCPEITFEDRVFCFTGRSQKCARSELVETIENRGGRYKDNVTQELDYLIIGADGNSCWAYAAYGRKVEAAVRLRKNGHKLLLVHEYDLWDAL